MNLEPHLTELNYNEVLLYLGYRGQDIDSVLESQIRRCMEEVSKVSRPRLVYRRVRKDALSLPGKDIAELLESSDEMIVGAITLGSEAEGLLRRREIQNMADAVILDSAESVAVENVADNFQRELGEELFLEGLYLTDRFSPGYGDLPLGVQSDLLGLLDASRRIGLAMTSGNLMVPRKSISFVMGVSRVPQKKRKRGCEDCSMFLSCSYRKEGRECR